MKRTFIWLILAWSLSSCDDGNLTQETINFDTATTQSCSSNNLILKIKGKEALLIETPKTTNFINQSTTVNDPILVTIDNSTNKVFYRFYNNSITSSDLCSSIPPLTASVNNEWVATSGKIQIITTAIKTTNTTTGRTTITGYNHNIIFKNISFSVKNGNQVYETFVFGDYKTSATNLPFNFDETLDQCSDSKQIYNFNTGESLTLDNVSSDLIINQATPLNTPRIGLIGTTTNKLVYRLFTNGIVTDDYFCNSTIPTSPTISQEWVATVGTAGTGGIIEVTTTKLLNTYTHRIVLKKVTFSKNNDSFVLGDSYVLGDLITTE